MTLAALLAVLLKSAWTGAPLDSDLLSVLQVVLQSAPLEGSFPEVRHSA